MYSAAIGWLGSRPHHNLILCCGAVDPAKPLDIPARMVCMVGSPRRGGRNSSPIVRTFAVHCGPLGERALP